MGVLIQLVFGSAVVIFFSSMLFMFVDAGIIIFEFIRLKCRFTNLRTLGIFLSLVFAIVGFFGPHNVAGILSFCFMIGAIFAPPIRLALLASGKVPTHFSKSDSKAYKLMLAFGSLPGIGAIFNLIACACMMQFPRCH